MIGKMIYISKVLVYDREEDEIKYLPASCHEEKQVGINGKTAPEEGEKGGENKRNLNENGITNG
jgi:hypothetical protein